jgi:hypothetical protein
LSVAHGNSGCKAQRASADDDLHPAIQAAVYFLKMTLFEIGDCSRAKLKEVAADEDIAEKPSAGPADWFLSPEDPTARANGSGLCPGT